MEPEKHCKCKAYQLFMLGLCVYVLVALAADTLLPLDESTLEILNHVDSGVCVIFLADFFFSLIRAEKKLVYLKWGWVDLISSIPTIELLRVGRLARIARILRLLRGVRATKMLVADILQNRAEGAFAAAALASIILIVFASIAILQCEAVPGANIVTAEDALWWSFVTMTTVGYGDRFPVTTEGHVVAAVLMTAGVGLFGTFTAFVASWFLLPGERSQEGELEAIKRELAEIKEVLQDHLPRRDVAS